MATHVNVQTCERCGEQRVSLHPGPFVTYRKGITRRACDPRFDDTHDWKTEQFWPSSGER